MSKRLTNVLVRLGCHKAASLVRDRWTWFILGLVLGLGIAELRGRIAVSFDLELPSLRAPERLLEWLVQPNPPVRNVVVYPLESPDDLTQLATFELRDEDTGAWIAHKAWMDIPVADHQRTLEDYAAWMRREGRLNVPVRGPGSRESYGMSALIVLLAVLITTAAGPRLVEQLRAVAALRTEVRLKRLAAVTAGAQAPKNTPAPTPEGDETHEFPETAPPMEAALPRPKEEPNDYSGEWYPVARKRQR